MPYNEFEMQALLYLELGKAAINKGNKGDALSNLTLALNIVVKEIERTENTGALKDLKHLIEDYLEDANNL